MKTLSPAKLVCTALTMDRDAVGEWFRLARTDDGLLCLELISDTARNRPGPPPDWAFAGDVPPHIAKQLCDDDDPDQVAAVLNRALRALHYA